MNKKFFRLDLTLSLFILISFIVFSSLSIQLTNTLLFIFILKPQTIIFSFLSVAWVNVGLAFKTRKIFGRKLSKKALTKIGIYLLIISFLVFYQIYFFGSNRIIFAQSSTPPTTSTSTTTSSTTTTSTTIPPTELNPGEIGFTIIPGILSDFTFSGNPNYLNVFWNSTYEGKTAVGCGFECDPAIYPCELLPEFYKCIPYPFIQIGGAGSCSFVNPPYKYDTDNTFTCLGYDVDNPTKYAKRTIVFRPIDFGVVAPSSIGATVGQSFDLQITLINTGLFTDSFTVDVTSGSPVPLSIEPSSFVIGPLKGMSYPYRGGVTSTNVKVAVLASTVASIYLDIKVCSVTNNTICNILPIMQPTSVEIKTGVSSLPDFSWFGIIQIIALSAVCLFALKKKPEQK
jgi:hypothetical protein